MQLRATVKTGFHLSASLFLLAIMSACGGGSAEESRVDNQLSKYVGTYVEDQCRSSVLTPNVPASITFKTVVSASDKPNTVNFASTTIFYESSATHSNCTLEIGSATAYGEMVYFGTLPDTGFSDPAMLPIAADKFQRHYTDLVLQGQVGFGFDELSDYEEGFKGILALDGNNLYYGDTIHFPLDAEGFPTKLYANSYSVRE